MPDTPISCKAHWITVFSIVEMTLGLLIPCMPAIATVFRRGVPSAGSKVTEYANKLGSHRKKQRESFGRVAANAGVAVTHGVGTYIEIGELESAALRQDSHESEARCGSPLNLGPHQILKTTEFEVRPASRRDVSEMEMPRPSWDGSRWV